MWLCKERIEADGWTTVQVFADRAMSGAMKLRPHYQKMLEGARFAEFDVIVSEALDRLSRDQEDVAGLRKWLNYAGVRLVTLAEGESSELHASLSLDKSLKSLRCRIPFKYSCRCITRNIPSMFWKFPPLKPV